MHLSDDDKYQLGKEQDVPDVPGMLTRNLWSKKLTDDVILEACERRLSSLDNPGFCLICGNEADGCEPDARNYECESCGAEQVFGAEELMLEIA